MGGLPTLGSAPVSELLSLEQCLSTAASLPVSTHAATIRPENRKVWDCNNPIPKRNLATSRFAALIRANAAMTGTLIVPALRVRDDGSVKNAHCSDQ
jgi:hypothetical protein